MKEKLRSEFYIALLLFSISLFSCNKNAKNDEHDHTSEQTYYCPMDTDIVQDEPGVCPKCKMNLVKKDTSSKDKGAVYYCPMCPGQEQNKPGICKVCNMDLIVKPDSTIEGNQDPITMPVNSTVFSKVRSIKPVEKTISIKIESKGYISYDPNRFQNVSIRYSGRIEKLYVKYAYQPVRKGQKLMEIFSHELRTAQHEYLFILKNDTETSDLINLSRQKLQLLGMTMNQIEDLEKAGHVHPITTIYSPYDGYVVESFSTEENQGMNSSPKTESASKMGSMNKQTANPSDANNDLLTREGTYVNKGQEIFKIVNADMVWGILDIYAENISSVKLNQPVVLKVENTGEVINGKINFIEPDYSNGSKTMKIRVYLNNKNHRLKIGNLLYAQIEGGNKKGMWIPKTAVIDLGNERVVFVKNKDVYQTRRVETGSSTSEEMEILDGISGEEEIAENAQYMIDSEGFVKLK
ncbi:MAG TPA: HlyD family efflux transporter periplasmic adaptor subunit [Cytophagaceae bacterium]|nr:HlyD family efflux transporter periplasmic adaptor subunit [Cytophagaceae bacterium]